MSRIHTHFCRANTANFSGLNRLYGVAFAFAFLLSSCKPENLKEGAVMEYFDIKGYFEHNAVQLNKKQKNVDKTVVHNGVAESKTVAVNDWGTELSLFAESDINKPAWKGSYLKKDSAGATVYAAIDPDLKTREIIISKTGEGSIEQIFIRNRVKNALYYTQETLIYFPDSAYVINKYQKVKLLGANTYKVTGKFN